MHMTRRQFMRMGLAGLAGAALSACASAAPTAAPAATAPAAGESAPAVRGYVAPGGILTNENVPGFYVRYYEAFRAPDPARWQLEIKGNVDAPTTMTLDHIARNLPLVQRSARMACVERWSSRAVWGGFTYADLAALVKPQPGAFYVNVACEDNYYESLPISELEREGVLFVTHMDGQPLGAKYGAPLRMIIPRLYGYKGAKVIREIAFSSGEGHGFWSDVGPYSPVGLIAPGRDRPLDLGGVARTVSGGEITDY